VLPRDFLLELRKLCDTAGALLILDEVFTGYGRTGAYFAFQHEDIVPDILVSSKGLASGYMPITAVTVKKTIYKAFGGDPIMAGLRYGYTTSGQPVACQTAVGVLDIMASESLPQKAGIQGKNLIDHSQYSGMDSIVDVRGLGLILVLEMQSPKIAASLQAKAKQKGLLVSKNNSSIMIAPPLIIDKKGIEEIIDILSNVLIEGSFLA